VKGAAKRVALEGSGWILLVVGIVAMPLPGPGLLGVFAGLALLSQQYDWAERRTEPVRLRALKAAAEGVETWLRLSVSLLGVAGLVACGVLWILKPPAPEWWPVSEFWWLPGGLGTGLTQILSAAVALTLIVYSYRRYHGRPEAVTELNDAITRADAAARAGRPPREDAAR
jgi:uncharacterized protein (TIGR02611 family)